MSGTSPGCAKAPPRTGVLTGQHVQAAGRDRTFTLAIPTSYTPTVPYPVVFVLHGSGGTAAGVRAQFDLERVSDGRAVIVYPQGVGGWDLDTPASSNRDVALFDAVVLSLHNTLCIDPRRVFVTGFSNGAYMANQLACRRGDRVRAVVTHAGGGPYELNGSYDAAGRLLCPGKAVASLVVHGDSDTAVLPSEGRKSLHHWATANRCTASERSAFGPSCVARDGCAQPVGVCRVRGLGHALWSEASKVTWAFFDALR